MRKRLPNRRDSRLETLLADGLQFEAGVGLDPATQQPREVFLNGGKPGSQISTMLKDVACVISVAVQHGILPADLAKSVGRLPDGGPISAVGAALDLMVSLEPPEPPEPRVAYRGADQYSHT